MSRTDSASDSPMISTREAAKITGLSHRTLEKKRRHGTGPRFCRLGGAVRYRRSDVEAWIEAHSRTCTAERGATDAL